MSIGCRKECGYRRPVGSETAIVRVPASTSNLGPGYDCLGVALRLYNEVRVSRGGTADAMAAAAGQIFFARTKVLPFRFSCSISGDVPSSRGLGSSVTVRLGILHALNRLSDAKLDRNDLFKLCASLEGHPDNAAPATYGGFTVARPSSAQRFAVNARLKFVLLIPDREVATSDARAVLPKRISRADAVRSCGNACSITAAFASGDYEKLRGVFDDSSHQPFREKLNPGLREIISAGENAGALGGFLSGSGSTIACVTLRNAEPVAKAMLAAAKSPKARVFVTTADNRGAGVVQTR